MNFKLHIWRQKGTKEQGYFQTVEMDQISPDTSFLEMLDEVNEQLILKKEDPVAFEHDCREGICGACSMVINGEPHGPQKAVTTCQLYMRQFKDGAEIFVEPFRAKPFPIIRDLITDRSSFDRIQQAGAYVSVSTGSAPEANSLPISKEKSDEAFQSAACIGCGACVATCKNGSASLFVAARFSQFASLPQGSPENDKRVLNLVSQMDKEGFGACSHTGACFVACPKEISLENIARLNSAFRKAAFKKR